MPRFTREFDSLYPLHSEIVVVNKINVDKQLADLINEEWHSIKPSWQYMSFTTDYYSLTKDQSRKDDIDAIRKNYGPVIDTQRFTDELYHSASVKYKNVGIQSFEQIRNNPKSRYNRTFPNTARLINGLQKKLIPPDYEIVRLMANMQLIRPEWSLNAPHPDFHDPRYITILYYVNDSDGDTYFFERGECINRASPIKGSAAVYPSSLMHAGSTPTKTETRVVINMCFAPVDRKKNLVYS